MKHLFTLLIACIIAFPIYAQEPEEVTPEVPEVPEVPELAAPEELEVPEAPELAAPEELEVPEAPEVPDVEPAIADTVKVMDKVEVIDSPDKTKVTLGENEVLIIEENGDTMRVKLGSRGISIIEGEDGTEINVMEMEEKAHAPEAEESTSVKKKKKFKPHWSGFELGLNNYVTSGYSMNLPQDQIFMDLNTGRSWNFNINFLEYGFGLGTDKVGLVTGLGLEMTDYVFDNQNSITKDDNGVIVEYTPQDAGNIVKSKFSMTYLTAPLLLEFQIPAGKKRIHISGGLIGGVKLGSNTKVKYEISGQKSKEKSKEDFNLAPLRYGATVRLGYRAINLYANYYFMSLFGENGGPELYPFSIGLTLINF